MENQRKNDEFLTEREKRLAKRNASIVEEFDQYNDGQVRPWRIYRRLADKHGLTAMGVYNIINRLKSMR